MPTRALNPAEIEDAMAIFASTIDYSRVRITRDSPWALGAPKAVCYTIHLKSTWGHFAGESFVLSPEGMAVLIHELAHVWQYENGGLGYIPGSLWAQASAWMRTGSRGGAYRWREPFAAKIPWAQWNPEQQAQAIEDYARARARTDALAQKLRDHLQPCIDAVQRGEGAAGW